MILYHFVTSPFARRVRLVLASKGLEAELRDPRVDATHWPGLHRANPLQTVPTLVDGERVLTDSLSIVAHLEALAPSPSIWPRADRMAEALELVRLADRVIEIFVDLGMRYHPVHDHARFAEVRSSLLGRARGALDRLGAMVEARAASAFLVGDTWTLADIAVVTTQIWLEGLPKRAPTFAPARQIVDLGWTVPAQLATWAEPRKARPDVAALLA